MAKKKYHDSGERMYEKRMNMMRGDSKGFANMPTEVVMKEYPKGLYGLPDGYDDTIGGIDAKASQNHSKVVGQMRGGDNDYR
jgi:hypothetical protein